MENCLWGKVGKKKEHLLLLEEEVCMLEGEYVDWEHQFVMESTEFLRKVGDIRNYIIIHTSYKSIIKLRLGALSICWSFGWSVSLEVICQSMKEILKPKFQLISVRS